ncbi:hypothetical protein GGI08_004632, partial [Coemansia sp. S2]
PAVEAAVEEPAVEAAAEEPAVEAAAEEPAVEAAVEEPAVEAAVEEPAVEAAVEEPVVEAAVVEPAVEAAVEEPAVEAAVEEPVVEAAVVEPAVEAVAEEPIAEAAVEEPAVEAAAEEPAVEAAVEEPAVEAVAEEPIVEAAVEEPVVEAAAEEPLVEEPLVDDATNVGVTTAEDPIEEFEDLASPADARDGEASVDSGSSDGADDFVLINAGDATGSPAAECQVVPSVTELGESVRPELVGLEDNDGKSMAARTLSVPLKHISDNVQQDTDAVAEGEPLTSTDQVEDASVVAEPVADVSPLSEAEVSTTEVNVNQAAPEPIATAIEPEVSTAPSDPGFVATKDVEPTSAPPAVAASTVGDLLNIDTIRSFDEVDASQSEVNVTTPSYVMHYPESLFGDTNSITPGLITMDDLHSAQKASAVVGVSAINATSVGRKSRDSGHHHHHLLGESEASVSQRMKRFIAGKRSDGPARSPSDVEPVSPTKGNVAGLFSQYRSSRTSVETKRASAAASALDSVAASELDLTETRGTRSATIHGSFEDELAKHGHSIPGSFPAENVAAGPGSDGEGVNPSETEHAAEGNTSENEGGKDRHRRHTILGVFKRMFR